MCKYLGIHLKHLNGHEDSNSWHGCTYKIPEHLTPSAVRIDVEHDCECHSKKEQP